LKSYYSFDNKNKTKQNKNKLELNNNFNNKSESALVTSNEVDFDSIWRLSFHKKQKSDKTHLSTQNKQLLSTNASTNLPFVLQKAKTQCKIKFV
jgi:hypothetical protein